MKKNLKWIICIISFMIFIILSILVLTRNEIYLDSFVYNNISKYISNDLTYIVKNLTHLASAQIVIFTTILVLIVFKNKKYGLFLGLDLILITIFQYILKFSFFRNRPLDINLIEENSYSFPSGHSLTAFAFYGFIIYLIYKSKISKISKSIYITLFSIVIIVVGFSRVYLGVHFFTDVLGSFFFSLSFLIIYITLVKERIR